MKLVRSKFTIDIHFIMSCRYYFKALITVSKPPNEKTQNERNFFRRKYLLLFKDNPMVEAHTQYVPRVFKKLFFWTVALEGEMPFMSSLCRWSTVHPHLVVLLCQTLSLGAARGLFVLMIPASGVCLRQLVCEFAGTSLCSLPGKTHLSCL